MKHSKLLSGMLGLGLALAGTASEALMIEFSPTPQSLFVGQTASVDIVLSGLEPAGPGGLGEQAVTGFNFTVNYTGDPTVQFLGATYGTGLGNPNDILETFILGPSPIPAGATGSVGLFETSLLGDAFLALSQGDSVVLATLSFTASSATSTTLSFSIAPEGIGGLVDVGTGFPVALVPTISEGAITWNNRNGGPQVPIPGTLLLLLGPLAWLARRATRIA
jgi:hypothetical protein